MARVGIMYNMYRYGTLKTILKSKMPQSERAREKITPMSKQNSWSNGIKVTQSTHTHTHTGKKLMAQ